MRKIQPYLFLILFVFLIAGYFYPSVGIYAILCMLVPVIVFAPFAGRYWCGNLCPRGSFYDTLLSKISPQKPIPFFFRSKATRLGMLLIIMTVFSIQTYYAWGDMNAIGIIFLRLIIITTLVGIILGVVYHQRTWCAFCPMGTMAKMLSPKNKKIIVSNACVGCKLCAKVCPSGLTPYQAKGSGEGFFSADCMRCGRCINVCPKKALTYKR